MYLERIRKTLGVGRKLVEKMEKMSIFEECLNRGIKFIDGERHTHSRYTPTKENIILVVNYKNIV